MQISVKSINFVGTGASAVVKFQETPLGGFHTNCEVAVFIENGQSLTLSDIRRIAEDRAYDFLSRILSQRSADSGQ